MAETVGIDTVAEVVEFLGSPRADVRKMGIQFMLQLANSEQGRKMILDADAIPALCRLTGDISNTADGAISCLINICADGGGINEMLKTDIINRIMETILSEDCKIRNHALMLLANVTTTEEGSRKMLQFDEAEGKLIGLHVHRLLRYYFHPVRGKDEWQYVASILCNISQLEKGREVLTKKPGSVLERLLDELKSKNPIRRRGIVSTVRNCCFEEGLHDWLLYELRLVPKILYLLSGPEELAIEERAKLDSDLLCSLEIEGINKIREPQAEIRLLLIETLVLLCSTVENRNFLRAQQVYPIIRNTDLVETDENVSETIYRLVNFLQRDEIDDENKQGEQGEEQEHKKSNEDENIRVNPTDSVSNSNKESRAEEEEESLMDKID